MECKLINICSSSLTFLFLLFLFLSSEYGIWSTEDIYELVYADSAKIFWQGKTSQLFYGAFMTISPLWQLIRVLQNLQDLELRTLSSQSLELMINVLMVLVSMLEVFSKDTRILLKMFSFAPQGN